MQYSDIVLMKATSHHLKAVRWMRGYFSNGMSIIKKVTLVGEEPV